MSHEGVIFFIASLADSPSPETVAFTPSFLPFPNFTSRPLPPMDFAAFIR